MCGAVACVVWLIVSSGLLVFCLLDWFALCFVGLAFNVFVSGCYCVWCTICLGVARVWVCWYLCGLDFCDWWLFLCLLNGSWCL